MTTKNATTLKQFSRKVYIHSSNPDKNGNLVIRYSLIIEEGLLGIKQTTRIHDYGGAKLSLYNHLIVERN